MYDTIYENLEGEDDYYEMTIISEWEQVLNTCDKRNAAADPNLNKGLRIIQI